LRSSALVLLELSNAFIVKIPASGTDFQIPVSYRPVLNYQ